MYQFLIPLHSLLRWFVLISLCSSVCMAYNGLLTNRPFTKLDNALRHWTATITHIQLLVGFTMYFKSPVIKFFFSDPKMAIHHTETSFFAVIHFLLMLTAIILITVGSALAKRRQNDHEKFKTVLTWFLIGLIIIFIAIPWPFSPFVNRAYFKPF